MNPVKEHQNVFLSAKRASMSKSERLSAARRKKKQILVNNKKLVLQNQPMSLLTKEKVSNGNAR
ncbi:MAG: hypothetical protein CM15mV26_0640 [uncultured marine virus]|nr:MAG: hypothetical protein CM15mV26_0640 [uncultured marine virus]